MDGSGWRPGPGDGWLLTEEGWWLGRMETQESWIDGVVWMVVVPNRIGLEGNYD